jgi:hypothetical protein
MGSSKLVDMDAKCVSIEDVGNVQQDVYTQRGLLDYHASRYAMCGLGREALGHLNTLLLDTTRS